MLRDYSMKEFISIVTKDPVFLMKNKFEHLGKTAIQKTIGLKGYEKIKKLVFSKA